MFEPRGHADMYGCLVVPPNPLDEDDKGGKQADFGLIFLHNEGYSTMCGHAVIAMGTLAVQLDWVDVPKDTDTVQIAMDVPCGRIEAFVKVKDSKDNNNKQVESVLFHCVPSFVVGLDHTVGVPGLGNRTIAYDLAYGGAFYAYVDLEKNDLDFDLSLGSFRQLIDAGMQIKRAVADADESILRHPFEDDLSFLCGTIFVDNRPQPSGADSRNVCIFAEGEVDRSPTGSGVSGRMAIHYSRGEMTASSPPKRIESITRSVFCGSIVREQKYGPFDAVIPRVEGITGQHSFVIDPSDPMRDGFIVR